MGKEKVIKSSLFLPLFGGLCLLLLLYIALQFLIFKHEFDQNLLKEASYIEGSFQNIFDNYQITLEKISNEIKENDLFSDKNAIEDVLKKAYVYGVETNSKDKIRTSGINWIGVEGTELTPIGRLGEIKSKPNFSSSYLKKLAENPGMLETSNALDIGQDLDFSFINLGIGVQDKDKKYNGFVNVRIDLNSLKELLLSKQGSNFHFILLDEGRNEILSSLPEELPMNESPGIVKPLKEALKNIFPIQRFIFSYQVQVKQFPYTFRFGYDQKEFYFDFLKQSFLSFFLLSSFLCFFSFFFYFYNKKFIKKALRFYKEHNREKNLSISHLKQENHQLVEREKNLENFIKSSENADKEEKKFLLEINERVSQSLSKMLDIANYLLNRIQKENKIEENFKELMEVFEHTYTHSRFFTLKEENNLVSIKDVLEEILIIFSKQLFKKELQIKIQNEKDIALLTDRTALKQTLINIIGRAIKNSPRKREISIDLSLEGKNICLQCRDKGYLGEQQSVVEERMSSLDCMILENSDMSKLVKSLGGTLSVHYKPYEGNTFLLQLPYQVSKEGSTLNEESDSQDDPGREGIGNIISFSAFKKIREH